MATKERRDDLKRMEADELYKKAEAYTKKTLTRWKPDWDNAATHFDKAGLAYKQANDVDRAIDACKRASECWYKQENLFLAAKSMENAAGHARDKDASAAAQLFTNASQMYQENGQAEKAAEVLGKAATSMADKDPAAAVGLYQQAIELYIGAEKEIYSNDLFRKCITLMVRQNMISEGIVMLKKHAEVLAKLNSASFQHKAYLSVIVLRLHLKDLVAAENDFQKFCADCATFSSSEEWFLANLILDAWDKKDAEKVEECANKQMFTFLENPIARIAKKLRLPEGDDEEGGGIL